MCTVYIDSSIYLAKKTNLWMMLEVRKKCPLNRSHTQKHTSSTKKRDEKEKSKQIYDIMTFRWNWICFVGFLSKQSDSGCNLQSLRILFTLLLLESNRIESNWKCGYWGSGMSRICAIKLEMRRRRRERSGTFPNTACRQSAFFHISNSLHCVFFFSISFLFISVIFHSLNLELE